MKKKMTCLICRKELFSEFGEGCKMCGMPLEKKNDFCCEKCIKKYKISRGLIENEFNGGIK